MSTREDLLADKALDKERKNKYNRNYFKDWYHNKGGKEIRKKTREPRDVATREANRRKHEKKDKIIEQMGGKCMDCGRSFHRNVYDFHHLDPSRKEGRVNLTQSMDKIQKEIVGCVLVCVNCHRMRHTEKG